MVAGAVAVALLAAGVYVAVRVAGGGSSEERPLPGEARDGSVALAAGTTVTPEAAPLAYEMRIRQDDYTGGELVTSTEHLVVRRPFDSTRTITRGERPSTTFASTFARSSFPRGSNGNLVTLQVAPAVASGDVRLDRALVDALPPGRLDRREVRRVAGRPCQVYRANGPVAGGPLAAISTEGEYADACVDGAGLLLEHVWVVDDRVLQRRVALEVEIIDPASVPATELGGDVVGAAEGGGTVRAVDPSSRTAGEFWSLPAPPEGFTIHGRYMVAHPVGEGDRVPDERTRLNSVADVYVAGADLVVIDRSATISQRQSFPPPDPTRERAEIAGLGVAELIPSARTNEARVLLSNGRAVRAYGTVPLARLVELLRALVKVDGPAELVYLD